MICTRGWTDARVGARSTTYGRPLRPGMPSEWKQVRELLRKAYCHLCGEQVGPCKIGSKKGDRWTKCYFLPGVGLFECLSCHAETVRADASREAAQDLRETPETTASAA